MKSNLEQYVWSLKYRPQTVEDTILPQSIKKELIAFRDSGNLPNMIFSGKPGVGKTTVAKALCQEMGIDYLFLNGSGEDRGIDTVKTKIARFASTVSWENNKRKMVIYDEADNLTADSQLALRSLIESQADNCGFILTCNYPGRIIDALHSRFQTVELKISKTEQNTLGKEVVKRAAEILKAEGIEFSLEVLKQIVIKYFPDIRRILNALQHYSSTGKIDEGILDYIKKTDLTDLISFLKKKEWTNMRKFVTENVDDPLDVIIEMYKNGHNYFVMETFPQAIIYLNEAQQTHVLAADKELNLVALLTKLMMDTKFQ